jgi:hypothetical protein
MYIRSAAFLITLLNITGRKFSNPDETFTFSQKINALKIKRLILPTSARWGRKNDNLFYSVGPPTFIYGM